MSVLSLRYLFVSMRIVALLLRGAIPFNELRMNSLLNGIEFSRESKMSAGCLWLKEVLVSSGFLEFL